MRFYKYALSCLFISILLIHSASTTYAQSQNTVIQSDSSFSDQEIKQVKQLARRSRSRLLEEHKVEVEQLWTQWHKVIADISQRQLKQDQLPDGRPWSFFSETKKSNLTAIKELTEKLLLNLRGTQSQALKKSYFELKTQIETYKKELIQDAEDQYAAPEENDAYFWQTHKGDYQELIKRKEKAIQSLKDDQALIVQDTYKYLTSLGIELTPQQVEQLFKRASSDIMLNLLVTFAHLNLLIELVSEKLQDVLHKQHYVQRADYYYSIYLGLVSLSLELHRVTRERMHTEQIQQVQHILNSMKKVRKNSKEILLKETRLLARSAHKNQSESGAFVEQLKQNLQVQEVSLKGIVTYQKYLYQQEQHIKSIEKLLARRLQVAFNTYQTVHLSQKFLTLVESGIKDLHNIRTIQIPAMLPVEQTRFVKVFDAVDRHLQGDINLVKSWGKIE